MPSALLFVLVGLLAVGLVVWSLTVQHRRHQAQRRVWEQLGFSPCPDRKHWLEETVASIEGNRGVRHEMSAIIRRHGQRALVAPGPANGRTSRMPSSHSPHISVMLAVPDAARAVAWHKRTPRGRRVVDVSQSFDVPSERAECRSPFLMVPICCRRPLPPIELN